jgi:cytochrome c-type biogenesis protein CcmH
MKLTAFLVVFMISGLVSAAVEHHKFATSEQQQTYESLTKELRCLVCQNQTIADSNADLAADLRRQVHEMIQQGKSRQDIVRFLTDRYGEFVLYNPPFKLKTGLLWLGPALFLLIGIMAIFLVVRKKKVGRTDFVDAEQRKKIHSLLEEGDQS